MKVYHVKTTVPKEVNDSEEFKRIIRVNMDLVFKKYNGFSVEKGVYFCYHSTFNDGIENENIFFFCDEYFFSKIKSTLEYIVNKFGGFEYGVEDITLDVKLERYDDEFFEKLFYSEDSDINNKFNLMEYLEIYTTHDDVLIKVFDSGVDSLNDFELNILETASKSL